MFCGKCGFKIDDGAAFCKSCGTKINGTSVANSGVQSSTVITPKGLHCPQCGSKRLQAIVESNTSGQGGGYSGGQGCLGFLLFGPLGLLCGSCGGNKNVTTTNKTFWVCQECGNKFRDKQEMAVELKRSVISLISLAVIIFIGSIAFFIGSSNYRADRKYDFAKLLDFFGYAFIAISVLLIILGIMQKREYNKLKIKQDDSMRNIKDS